MIDEFKIQKQVAGIEASAEPPLRKARLILRLARRIRSAAKNLGQLSQRSFREGDALRAARMREAGERLIEAHAEVRAHAGAALTSPLPSGGEEGPPREATQGPSSESPLASPPRGMGVRGRLASDDT